jgi:hypothetical protein
VITQLGLKAFNLATLYKDALEPRMPAGTIEGIGEDVGALSQVVSGAMQVHQEAEVATAEQMAAARKGFKLARAVRRAVKKCDAPKEVQKAYGVGHPMSVKIVRDVSVGLQKILDRAAEEPAEAAGLGILQKDLDAMAAAYQKLKDADKEQELKRANAPLSTKERNRTANRILKGVARVVGAGLIEFAGDEERTREFEALKPAPRAKKKSNEAAAKAKAQARAKARAQAAGKAP